MPLSQQDRITFSLKIVSSDTEIKGLNAAKAQLQVEIDKAQALDDANNRLITPITTLINGYQSEFNLIDGNVRSTFTEQDIQDSAAKKLGNFFFPNNVQLSIPDLASVNNIWTKMKPFAMAYGVGKNYSQAYGSGPSELSMISALIAEINSAISTYTDIQLTTGQHCVNTGTCSLTQYTDQTSCTTNGGIWTAGPEVIEDYPEIHTLHDDLVSKVNALVAQLTSEAASVVTNDSNVTAQSQNNAAISNINTVIIPALNTWLAYPDYNTATGQTTCAGFNGYDANLLAPTKLHVAQLNALLSALNARNTFLTTRQSQLNTNLGTITQDLSTGDLTGGSGLYKKRFDFLVLRLNALNGSTTKLVSLKSGSTAQDGIISSIQDAKNTYLSILPTSVLVAPGNDGPVVHASVSSYFSQGDTVYIMADGQVELLRAVKSVNGNAITLNDIVPSKYRTTSNLRIYKDIS